MTESIAQHLTNVMGAENVWESKQYQIVPLLFLPAGIMRVP
jgi:hypothetical protein